VNVDPALFADAMEAKFKFYENVTSPALRAAWVTWPRSSTRS
jgi:hypothetical protein